MVPSYSLILISWTNLVTLIEKEYPKELFMLKGLERMAILKLLTMSLNTLKLKFLRVWVKRPLSLPGFQQLQEKRVHQILREIQEVTLVQLRFFHQILYLSWKLGYDWQQYSYLFHKRSIEISRFHSHSKKRS
jgi:hypothetical protein